jgi:uncharacterized protein YkwD/uncharacterized protein YraI
LKFAPGACLVPALFAFVLLAPAVAASPASPAIDSVGMQAVTSGDACVDDEEVGLLALINDYRAASGLQPVSVSASLSSAAAYHSIDMAANGYLAHTLIDGTSVPQNMANFGYEGGTHGETLAAGTATAQEVLQIWQGSGEHNAIVLGSGFGAIGIGRAYDAASPYGWYWTAIFADVNDGPGWLCGEAAPPSKSVSLFQSVDGAVSEGDVNLRSGPGTDYAIVSTLPAGTSMTVTGREMQAFLPVKVDGQYGWVGAEWVERGAMALEQPAAPGESGGPGTATAVGPVEFRNAPAESGGVLGTIPGVAVVTLTGAAQDGFLGVVYEGQEGWADASYLAVAEMAPDSVLLQPTGAPVSDGATTAEMAPAPALDTAIGAEAIATVDVNLRAQPSPTAPVLSVVPAGSPVSLTGSQANGYANVRIAGQAGWIDTAYLQ